MADIAAVGFDSDIVVLKACGIDIYPVKNADKTAETLEKLTGKYSIIIIDEALAEYAQKIIEKFDNVPVPIIFPIPLSGKTTGKSRERISKIISKALGVSETRL